MSGMNFKKWKLGLAIATAFALFAGVGTLVDPGAGWRAFVGAFSAALMTNWAAYLMKHPIEEISDTSFISKENPKP